MATWNSPLSWQWNPWVVIVFHPLVYHAGPWAAPSNHGLRVSDKGINYTRRSVRGAPAHDNQYDAYAGILDAWLSGVNLP